MRLGVGIGPFYASGSTRSRKGDSGCGSILALAFLVGLVITYWKIALAVVCVGAAAWLIARFVKHTKS